MPTLRLLLHLLVLSLGLALDAPLLPVSLVTMQLRTRLLSLPPLLLVWRRPWLGMLPTRLPFLTSPMQMRHRLSLCGDGGPTAPFPPPTLGLSLALNVRNAKAVRRSLLLSPSRAQTTLVLARQLVLKEH